MRSVFAGGGGCSVYLAWVETQGYLPAPIDESEDSPRRPLATTLVPYTYISSTEKRVTAPPVFAS